MEGTTNSLVVFEKTTSIVAKLKEFKTKWDRIGILVSRKYFYNLKDIEEGVSVIDRVYLVTFCDLWSEHMKEHMKEHYPAILPAIKSPRVDVASNRLHSQVQMSIESNNAQPYDIHMRYKARDIIAVRESADGLVVVEAVYTKLESINEIRQNIAKTIKHQERDPSWYRSVGRRK